MPVHHAMQVRVEDVRKGDLILMLSGLCSYHVHGVERIREGGPWGSIRLHVEAMQGLPLGSNDDLNLTYEPGHLLDVVRTIR